MNILSEIINPIVEFTVQACEAAVKALVDAKCALALYIIYIIYRCQKLNNKAEKKRAGKARLKPCILS